LSLLHPTFSSDDVLHQVFNLADGYQPLDKLHWASIFVDRKVSEELGTSSSVLYASGPSTLSIIFNLKTKGMVGVFLRTEGGKAAVDLENSLMAFVWIEILQQKFDHSALC
jgi:hypothetical protein